MLLGALSSKEGGSRLGIFSSAGMMAWEPAAILAVGNGAGGWVVGWSSLSRPVMTHSS